MAERALAEVRHFVAGNFADFDRHGATFDFGQIENFVDQGEQVVARTVDGLGVALLLFVEVARLVVGQHLREDEQRIERGAQLVAHVGQKLALVFGGEGQLLRLLFQGNASVFHLGVLVLDLGFLLAEELGLFLQFLVGLLQLLLLLFELLLGGLKALGGFLQFGVLFLQLALLALQFLRQRLGLFQQLLGAGVGLDRIDDNTQALHQLVEKRQVGPTEALEARQLDDGLDLALEDDRQHREIQRLALAQTGTDLDVVGRDIGEQDALPLQQTLADQPLARAELSAEVLAVAEGVAGHQPQEGILPVRLPIIDVEDTMLRIDQRGEVRERHLADGLQIALPLELFGEIGEVGLQPVLLGILVGGGLEIFNHLVDVVLEQGHLARRLDGDGPA